MGYQIFLHPRGLEHTYLHGTIFSTGLGTLSTLPEPFSHALNVFSPNRGEPQDGTALNYVLLNPDSSTPQHGINN